MHLLLPGIMIALVGLRSVLAGHRGHPQSRGTGQSVVGVRFLPTVAARTAALFAVTVGLLGLMGGLFQVNPVWSNGPANAAHVSAGSTPPWYFGWVDGAVRLWPAWGPPPGRPHGAIGVHDDRAVHAHGIPTGIIIRLPHGGYVEPHRRSTPPASRRRSPRVVLSSGGRRCPR